MFLEVQDGLLGLAGKILNRMVELKGLSEDVMKNDSDKENYNRVFRICRCKFMILLRHSLTESVSLPPRDSDSAVGGSATIGSWVQITR